MNIRVGVLSSAYEYQALVEICSSLSPMYTFSHIQVSQSSTIPYFASKCCQPLPMPIANQTVTQNMPYLDPVKHHYLFDLIVVCFESLPNGVHFALMNIQSNGTIPILILTPEDLEAVSMIQEVVTSNQTLHEKTKLYIASKRRY